MNRLTCIAILLAALLSAGLSAQDQSARDIVKESVDRQNGESSKSLMTMKIIRPEWEREVSIKSWTLGNDYMLMLITAPPRDQGTAFLKRGNEIWNWQPRIRRSIKLPPSMMSQSWMGSDFTNDDLVEQSSMVEDYNHTHDGTGEVDGYACHRIIMEPKPDAAVVWGKVIIWIEKEDYMQMKAEFYDERGELVNTMYGRDPGLLDGVRLPTVLEVVPADEPGNRTVISIDELDFGIDVTKDFFTEQQMKRVR